MNIKKNIRKALLLAFWILLACCVLVLSIAAVDVKKQQACRGVDIKINGVKEYLFLTRKDITDIISDACNERPEGKALATFNLQELESTLEKNVWIRDAELFFDNNERLHVLITEKEPVARIFTTGGLSFYIDSTGGTMPLSEKVSVKIPVFTGFPTNGRSAGSDSALMQDIRAISREISREPFWMAQIAQVAILPEKNFEMIPTVGSHIIQFGNGDSAAAKFRRLLIFYTQVLGKTGVDKYTRISVQYDKQVIGTKKGLTAKYDSVQALKNIMKMIEEARKVYADTVFTPSESFRPSPVTDTITRSQADTYRDSYGNKILDTGQQSVTRWKKSTTPGKQAVKEKNEPTPKAIMKKENGSPNPIKTTTLNN